MRYTLLFRTFVRCLALFMAMVSFVSCDDHEAVDTAIHPGYILCADGTLVSEADYFGGHHSPAVGVVFTELTGNRYYVVSVDELPPVQFCDTLGMDLGTSGDVTAFDGRINTIAMRNAYDEKIHKGSPLASAVFQSHRFGETDFIPSVAEMKAMFAQRGTINRIFSRLNEERPGTADLLETDGSTSGCMYWTSTEVSEDKTALAWRFSMSSGTAHEAAKTQFYRSRIISFFYP